MTQVATGLPGGHRSPAMVRPGAIWRPLPWQVAAWRSQARVLLIHGGAGSDKSSLAAEKIHALLLRYPSATGLVVRKFSSSVPRSCGFMLQSAICGYARFNSQKRMWEYPNGSILLYGGLADEKQREALKSVGLRGGVDFIWIEEANALSLEDYQVLMTRLRGTAAGWCQVILTCNPDHKNHWINKTIIEAKPDNADIYWANPQDNPSLSKEYLATLDGLTGIARDRYWLGRWVSAEGLVWPYDPSLHLIDPVRIPAEWRRVKSIDFGYSNPASVLWLAQAPDGDIHVYRQIYKTAMLVSDKAAMIKSQDKTEPTGSRCEATVADHDAEDRATLEREGIKTRPAHKAVRPGLEAVSRRFASRTRGRRILIHRNSLCHAPDPALVKAHKPTHLVDELLQYQLDSDGKDGYPIKQHDHACDALRYGVCYLDGVGADELSLLKRIASH